MKNESWFPLGIPWKQERFLLWTGLLLSAGAGLVLFLCQYLPARGALYGYDGTVGPDGALVRVLLPGTLMPPFPHLLYGLLLCFLALALSLAGVAVYHFLCHYQGGRSIYRMRLLPQSGGLGRRWLAGPPPGPAAGRGADGRRHPAVRTVLLPPDTCGPPAPGALGRPAAGLDWRQPCLK